MRLASCALVFPLLFAASLCAHGQPTNIISAVAGGGVGDGLPALQGRLNSPQGVLFHPDGSLYVSDTGHARVRKVDAGGNITTVFTGQVATVNTFFPLFQAGPASCPGDMALHPSGDLLVADPCAHVVRRITTGGAASVFAGSGVHATPFDAPADGGPATQANMARPTYVAADAAGNVFIVEPDRNRIRKVDPSGTITTFAGTPTINSPNPLQAGPIVADGAGGAFTFIPSSVGPYSAPFARRIVRIDAAGAITVVAGDGTTTASGDGGPATSAGLGMVQGLARDGSGNLFATFPDRIRRIVPGGNIDAAATVGGGDVALSGADFLVTRSAQHQVVKVTAVTSAEQALAGNGLATPALGDGGSALEAGLQGPTMVVADRAGAVYIADTNNHRIRKVDGPGIITTIGGTGTAGFSGDNGPATAAMFAHPAGLAVDASGNLFVGDMDNRRVRRIDAAGVVTTVAGTGAAGFAGDGGPATAAQIGRPASIALDEAGNLYIADGENARIRKVTSGTISTVRQNVTVSRIAIEPSGSLLIAGGAFPQGAVSRLTGTTLTPVAGIFENFPEPGVSPAPTLTFPQQAVSDPSGVVYIADFGLNRLLRKSAGVGDMLAGSAICPVNSRCTRGSSGDGGPASDSTVNGPTGMFWDPASGYLYFADTGNNRIRKVDVALPLPLPFTIAPQSGVPVASAVAFAAFTPGGYSRATSVSVGAGAEHSVGCTGTFTATAGNISPGQSLCVRHTSSALNNATLASTVTVGGRTASFTSTTIPGPGSAGLSAATVDFGPQSMGADSGPRTVTITNTGAVAITVNDVTASQYFSVVEDCATLAPGATCTVTVTFKPMVEDPVEGALTLQLSPGTQTVVLRGSGEKSLTAHYYRSILGREPDAPGKAFWDGEAARVAGLGANPNEVWYALAMKFFVSAEYVAFNRDNAGFVTDLYRTFFSRAPDSGGLAFWSGQLASGLPREVLLAQFMFSPEFTLFTRAVFGDPATRAEVDIVMDFYRGLLATLPDTTGFNHWVGRFRIAECTSGPPATRQGAINAETTAISIAFITSPEYVGRNRSDTQFVGDLYNAFLRRGGDLGGVQFWVGRLAAGQTREQLRAAFQGSLEFQIRQSRLYNETCIPLPP